MNTHFNFLAMTLSRGLKRSINMKTGLILDFIAIIVRQSLFLAAWSSFFAEYRQVNGWSFHEMLLMSGCVSMAVGFADTLFYGLREVSTMVTSGKIDVYLLQPKNTLFNIATSRSDPANVGEFMVGILFIWYSGYLYEKPIEISVAVLCNLVFIFALFTYLGSVAFFLRNSKGLIYELYQAAIITASQPNSAYSGGFHVFTITILPVAFLTFYPIEFVRKSDIYNLLMSLGGTFLFLAISVKLFYKGLSRYKSGLI